LQGVIPLLIAIIPITVNVIATLLHIDTGNLTPFLMLSSTWLPVFNSVATLVLLAPYRRLLIRFLTSGSFSKGSRIHPFMVNTSKDPARGYKPWENYIDQGHSIAEVMDRRN
jgi:hypothetical protein